MQLSTVGGKDRPDLASGESFAIALDFAMRPDDNTTSHVFDVIVGVPSGQPVGMYELPCSRGFTGDQLLTMARCAGVYDYQATDAAAFSRRFLKETILDNATWPFANAIANTSAEAPDLEWTIRNITALRNRFSTNSTSTSWSFKLRAFGGSFEDAGIGEDYVPGGQAVTTVELSIGESKTTTTVLPASTTSSNIATEESTQAPNEQPTTTTTTTTTSTTTTTTTIDSMSFEATTGIATSSSMDSTESSTTLEVIAQASSTSADVLTTTFDENSNSSSVGEAEEDADDEDDDQNSAAWRALATSILIISTTFHINGI